MTTSLVSVIVSYFALCSENYHWWWLSFFSGASCGFYVFLYGVFYFFRQLDMSDYVSMMVYFSWTMVISSVLGLMTGTVGFLACLIFVRKIYQAIKID